MADKKLYQIVRQRLIGHNARHDRTGQAAIDDGMIETVGIADVANRARKIRIQHQHTQNRLAGIVLRLDQPCQPLEGAVGDDCVGVFHTGNGVDLFIDEMADIIAVLQVKLHQQVPAAGSGIHFRGNFRIRQLVATS